MNQLSIYGAVSNRCEQFGLTQEEKTKKKKKKQKESVTRGVLTGVKSQEVKLLVSLPKLVSGSILRENIQDPPLLLSGSLGLKLLRRPKVHRLLINLLIPRINSNRPKVDQQVYFAINLFINLFINFVDLGSQNWVLHPRES